MIERVAETITRYSMLPPKSRVAVAVSGGPDSVCLLHVLRALANRFELTLSVVHLNHLLRGEESDEDARWVASLAESMGLACVVRQVDVDGIGGNLEEAGRDARIELFRSLLSRGEASCIATGHTASDQAETVLMRLIRGAGTTGLRGILPVTQDGRVRPLIECDRSDVETYLKKNRINWRTDASNEDCRFLRNRIRRQILPLLRQENPRVEATLTRTAALASEIDDYFRREVASTGLVGEVVETGALQGLHPAVARRIVRDCLRAARGDLRRITASHTDQVLDLALRDAGYGTVTLPGLRVDKSQDWLRFAKPGSEVVASVDGVALTAPGAWGFGPELVRLELIDTSGGTAGKVYTGGDHLVDADRAVEPLFLRGWQPGDRLGLPGHKPSKLKSLFQRARVPAWDRVGWPVIVSGNQIVWTKRFGVAEQFAAGAESRRVLRVTVETVVSSV